VLSLVREHRRFFLGATLAALILRISFLIYFPAVTDDSRVYADLATNWLHHGIYGQTQVVQQVTHIVPTDTRLPGYPAFLAVMFWIFGVDRYTPVLLAQILLDLVTCFIIADIARRTVSDRAARIAFLLAALCPFLANYSAAALTETLEIFFTALALDCAVTALGRGSNGLTNKSATAAQVSAQVSAHKTGANLGHAYWAATGAAIAACILLRPDGGILLAAVLLYLVFAAPKGRRIFAVVIVAVFALAPLVPWTIRNFHTLHHFEPLAPRYANETEELTPMGFNRWVKTWIADYASVEEIYWNVQGDKIDPEKLPSRAMDTPSERDETLALIADYNQPEELTPELDARFGRLAAERIRAHPLRYYMTLPLLRIADMWLRPRTDLLPPDVRWWEFNDDPKESALAVGFGLLNLAYVGMALWGLFGKRQELRWVGLFVCFLVLRTAFLGTIENPEPRYTLECYPVIILLAGKCCDGLLRRRF